MCGSAPEKIVQITRNENPMSIPLQASAHSRQFCVIVVASAISSALTGPPTVAEGMVPSGATVEAKTNRSTFFWRDATTWLNPAHATNNTSNKTNPQRFFRQISHTSAAEGEFIVLVLGSFDCCHRFPDAGQENFIQGSNFLRDDLGTE